ncbi:hypothetical protein NC99_30900 [Sunxiuqinia dokdonensis]|uniref:Uncharacterized protein n=1 Tax=Sunxiuqinia dokdonensis TaxID=1409788 RepID=A0A0L8V7B6_9BACT|nr:hypothetical protein NC99_30900 [Sunxiuqinia dokdonensis]
MGRQSRPGRRWWEGFLVGIQGCAPERKNPEVGRRVTLTRFLHPFYQ